MTYEGDEQFVEAGYGALKASMADVQKRGAIAQEIVKQGLEAAGISFRFRTRVPYLDGFRGAEIEVDFIVGDIYVDVTHSEPAISGHSNENKLHQALAELYLLKTYNPDRQVNLVIGGRREKWAQYVLRALEMFYDHVAFTEDEHFADYFVEGLHQGPLLLKFWRNERHILGQLQLIDDESRVNERNGRFDFYRDVVQVLQNEAPPQYPNQLANPLLAKMARDGQNSNFWRYMRSGRLGPIWQERNYFNPLEAAVELILEHYDIWFKGGLGKSVPVHHSVLHDMGFPNTRFTEDFLLYSEKLGLPVYLQCKSAAGGVNLEALGRGKTSTTKAVPDRAREQIGRSILYRTHYDATAAVPRSRDKDYLLVHVIDGNWSGPKDYRLKYVHLLQFAGTNAVYTWSDVITDDYKPNMSGPLGLYLLEVLGCKRNDVKQARPPK